MIVKDDAKEVNCNSIIDPLNDDGLVIDLDDERAKYTASEYSFSSLCNYKADID